ncbi:MAG: hypothetical protein MZV70_07215 [Desulfobacterales bacterium]|nr:hypothetical protein [Desulfobacterales bacterium]
MDRSLYPFQTLKTTGVESEDGDKAFDEEEIEAPARVDEEGNEVQPSRVIPIAMS